MDTTPHTPAPARRVLVIKLSSLGDLFHALPAVHGLRAGWGAAIDWAVHPPYQDLVRCFRDVRQVVPLDRSASPRALLDNLRRLRAQSYDWVVDLQGILKSAVAARAARARRRLGPSFHREGARWLYDAVAGPRDKQRHAVDELLDAVRCLGLPVPPPVFPVAFPAQRPSEPRPRVALVPWSRWPSKTWPAPSFARVAAELQEQAGASLYVLGGPGDRPAAEALCREIGRPAANLAGALALPALGGLLQAMDLVIGNDSGPVHMAASVGTPVLALFGPTDPLRTGPYGAGHRVLRAQLRCQPCFSRRCRFRDTSCLRAITPDTVTAHALEMLRTPRPPPAETPPPS